MRFIVKKSELPNVALYLRKTDIVHLKPDSWNDYGFVTGFSATLHPQDDSERTVEIGFVKILKEFQQANSKTFDLLKQDNLLEFESLPEGYYSLGQNQEFYQSLSEQGEDLALRFTTAINDVHKNLTLGHKFENSDNPGFETSLLRSSAAYALYKPFSKTELGFENKKISEAPHFNVSIQLEHADKPHKITFDFRKAGKIPNRIFVLVGKNGVGKTQVLGELAFLISGGAKSESKDRQIAHGANEISSRGIFHNVIAFSFSAFDDFEVPVVTEDSRTSYRYWGLRSEGNEPLTTEKLVQRINITAQHLSEVRKEVFSKYLDRVGFAPSLNMDDIINSEASKKLKEKTSAGQRMILATLIGLVSFLKKKSILLFDEPETHLHPSMLANLMLVINGLLKEYDSYAIISTHSPIVLQQVPSRFIRVIRRLGNTPKIDELAIESFGENLTEISQEIFDVGEYELDYKDVFENLLKSHTLEEIMAMFDNRLGLSAKALLHSLTKRGQGF